MATIKPIEGRSVHQIQSGQVIVDLCSVVKELVENALDASATSLDIRFKNNGLDLVEVVDNGSGIAPDDFDSIALKHYTSKLNKYDDLSSLTTFGFRGEALSSLCALSRLTVVTSRQQDAPKGTKLEFETSGKLKARSIVAAQRGTAVAVEDIFRNLPVRRRELEKNIKREYSKAIGLLHAYACISTGVRFSVSNVPSKGKKLVVFSTKSNPTTRENIVNVYGAKAALALTSLDIRLELEPTRTVGRISRVALDQDSADAREVRLKGHISRPVVGEGRQTPDRQMFFVNSRPCALPQVSKAINEVYKSFNVTQSPFIFANLELDTDAYDVNVSPDKRTILLHDQTALLDALKERLTELFEQEDQSVPQAAISQTKKLPTFKQLTVDLPTPHVAEDTDRLEEESSAKTTGEEVATAARSNKAVATYSPETRADVTRTAMGPLAARKSRGDVHACKEAEITRSGQSPDHTAAQDAKSKAGGISIARDIVDTHLSIPRPVQDFNLRMGVDLPTSRTEILSDTESEMEDHDGAKSPKRTSRSDSNDKIASVSNTPQKLSRGIVDNAFDRMRPQRMAPDVATVTIGDQTTKMTLGSSGAKRRRIHTPRAARDSSSAATSFVSGLQVFSALNTRVEDEEEDDEVETGSTSIRDAIRRHSSTKSSTKLPSATISQNEATDDESLDSVDESEVEQTRGNLNSAPLSDPDGDYVDEVEKKAEEEARIARMIKAVEEKAVRPTSDSLKRATSVLKGRTRKDSTLQLMQCLDTSIDRIEQESGQLLGALSQHVGHAHGKDEASDDGDMVTSAEERLSLTVTKSDFSHMRIVGQFNLGFILVVRNSSLSNTPQDAPPDELFIIDQHASDEKYNFERLQSQTIVQNQRLVHAKQLDLTAIEEEIILNHSAAIQKNGFEVSIDTSGDIPVGQRCKLTSLPMSREVTFSLADLEELLALLADHPEASSATDVPRPSKVRKMFAMRACRSSIMVGKTLTQRQMEKVVRHMGELDKPWNCPHGRPTMRHLFSTTTFNGWQEGDGLTGLMEENETVVDWKNYIGK